MNDKDYKKFYLDYVKETKDLHSKNSKKIRNGLWVNIFLPLIFLIISFMIGSSKLVFLILWIVSLFGIAFYLIYVEYIDYLLQEKIKLLETDDKDEVQVESLIGDKVVETEISVNNRMDARDEKMEARLQKIEKKLESRKRAVSRKKHAVEDQLDEKINEIILEHQDDFWINDDEDEDINVPGPEPDHKFEEALEESLVGMMEEEDK